MNKRYNKSESRKGKSYNKSKRRRPHPPYQESSRVAKPRRPVVETLEAERGDAVEFDIKVPELNWEVPKIPEIEMGELAKPLPEVPLDTDIITTPKTKTPATAKSDAIELPEFEVPTAKPKSRERKVKVKSTTTAPSSLGGQSARNNAEQMRREMQGRQAQQQQPKPSSGDVHPAAIIGPIVMMIIAIAFVSSIDGLPDIVYLLIMFFFGRQIWNVIQGNKK